MYFSILLFCLSFTLSISPLISQEFVRTDSTISDEFKIWKFEEESTPWIVHVIEIDLTQEEVTPKVALANDRISHNTFSETFTETESLASLIDRKIEDGADIIRGINADFVDMATGMVFNVTASEGQLATYGITQTPHAGFDTDEEGNPYIGLIEISQTIALNDTLEREIHGVNNNRTDETIILYNRFIEGNQSSANEWGHEILLQPIEEVAFVNGTLQYVVVDEDGKVTRENEDQIIASGHGSSSDFLENASEGDTITITTSFEGIADSIHVVDMVGGWGHIVHDGDNRAEDSIEEEGSMSHENERHPRSAVGYNADKTRLYLVAAEGRSDNSAGMNLSELADFMIHELEVSEGLNFDGGGSTTLMSGTETINDLSDGGQRSIPTALIIQGSIMTALFDYPEAEENIQIYPNPTADHVTLEWDRDSKIGQMKNLDFRIHALDGKMVWEEKLNFMNQDARIRINLPQTAPGQYFYTLRAGSSLIASGKLVIQ